MTCPHCHGDGCNPFDFSTLLCDECPVCGSSGRVSARIVRLYFRGIRKRWSWEKWHQVMSEVKA